MYRRAVLSLIVVFSISLPVWSFFDPITAVTNNVRAAEQRAHELFVEAKWVENIRILMQNYEQSVSYYNYMKSLTEYKGGIGAYVRDRITSDVDQANKEEYWRFQNWVNSDPDETAYVRKFTDKASERAAKRLDYSKQIHEIGLARDVQIKEMAADAAKEKMSPEDKDRFERKTTIINIEILNELNKNIQQLLAADAQREQNDLEFFKEHVKQQETQLKSVQKIYNRQKQLQDSTSASHDPYAILREIPR